MTNKTIVRNSNIHSQIDHIGTLDRTELGELWKQQFSVAPPKGVKRGLLERAEAYRLQTKRFGRLKPNVRKRLISLASASEADVSIAPRRDVLAGTRFVREWHGKTYQVTATNDGFDWNGKTYRSLSAIAKEITGAKWSGPRFFGIDK